MSCLGQGVASVGTTTMAESGDASGELGGVGVDEAILRGKATGEEQGDAESSATSVASETAEANESVDEAKGDGSGVEGHRTRTGLTDAGAMDNRSDSSAGIHPAASKLVYNTRLSSAKRTKGSAAVCKGRQGAVSFRGSTYRASTGMASTVSVEAVDGTTALSMGCLVSAWPETPLGSLLVSPATKTTVALPKDSPHFVSPVARAGVVARVAKVDVEVAAVEVIGGPETQGEEGGAAPTITHGLDDVVADNVPADALDARDTLASAVVDGAAAADTVLGGEAEEEEEDDVASAEEDADVTRDTPGLDATVRALSSASLRLFTSCSVNCRLSSRDAASRWSLARRPKRMAASLG